MFHTNPSSRSEYIIITTTGRTWVETNSNNYSQIQHFQQFHFLSLTNLPTFSQEGGKKEKKTRKRKEDHLGCVGVIYTASFRFITCNTGLFRMCFRPRLSRPPSSKNPLLPPSATAFYRWEEKNQTLLWKVLC